MRRLRITTRQVMIAVAIAAVACVGVLRWSGIRERQLKYQYAAREYRWRESILREAVGRFEACSAGHADCPRDELRCQVCQNAWGSSYLNYEVQTPAEAIAALRQSADVLGRWAERYERGASRPWGDLPPPTRSDSQSLGDMMAGRGPISVKFFEMY